MQFWWEITREGGFVLRQAIPNRSHANSRFYWLRNLAAFAKLSLNGNNAFDNPKRRALHRLDRKIVFWTLEILLLQNQVSNLKSYRYRR